MRRLVYDNDHQPRDTKGILPVRWQGGEGGQWAPEGEFGFQHSGKDGPEDWLRYQHIVRPDDWPKSDDLHQREIIADIKTRQHNPQLITDFSGYNSYQVGGLWRQQGANWVGDLMLECAVTVQAPTGELWLELAKGVDRFQARWDLANGSCSLVRFKDGAREEILDTKPTVMNKAGTFNLRFANVDERLTVWVDSAMPFKDGVEYARAWSYDKGQRTFVNTGPTAHDLKPASIASKKAAVQVKQLKLWRDSYYTARASNPVDADLPMITADLPNEPIARAAVEAKFWSNFWSTPERWEGTEIRQNDHKREWSLRRLTPTTMFVQPGHFLCLGDNSPESSDSRSWGTVPQRLMLGRAVAVYWPPNRLGIIR